MTDRAAIVAKITAIIASLAGIENITLSPCTPLILQGFDSLDLADLRIAVEEEFGVEINEARDWTIDKIADAVVAARGRS